MNEYILDFYIFLPEIGLKRKTEKINAYNHFAAKMLVEEKYTIVKMSKIKLIEKGKVIKKWTY